MKLAELFTEITVKDSKFKQSMKTNRRLAESLKKSFVGISRVARVMLIGIGLIGFASVKAASEAAEMGSKFAAVFKEETKNAEKFAEILSKKVNRSVIDIRKSMAGLQDIFVPLGFARLEARLLSQQMIKLAIDVGSFNDVADADVIRDFESALVGNSETVRKYGIIITEAIITQELMAMGLNKTSLQASALEKVQARLNIIMKGTVDAQGDAERTSGSFANQLRGLWADTLDFRKELGDALIPAIKEFIIKLREGLPIVSKWINEHKGATAAIFGTTVGLLAFTTVALPAGGAIAQMLSTFREFSPLLVRLGVPLGRFIFKLQMLAPLLGKIALGGAVAFVGWKIGKQIGELTNLGEKLTGIAERLGIIKKTSEEITEKQRIEFELGQKFRDDEMPGTNAWKKKMGVSLTPKKIKPEEAAIPTRSARQIKAQIQSEERAFKVGEARRDRELAGLQQLEDRKLITIKDFAARRFKILTDSLNQEQKVLETRLETATTAEGRREIEAKIQISGERNVIKMIQLENEIRRLKKEELHIEKQKTDEIKRQADAAKRKIDIETKARRFAPRFTGITEVVKSIQLAVLKKEDTIQSQQLSTAKKHLKVAEDTKKIQNKIAEKIAPQAPVITATAGMVMGT